MEEVLCKEFVSWADFTS